MSNNNKTESKKAKKQHGEASSGHERKKGNAAVVAKTQNARAGVCEHEITPKI